MKSELSPRFVVIASTGGSVMGRLLDVPYFRERILEVVSDRDCGALRVADSHGVPAIKLPAKNGLQFSELLYHRYSQGAPGLFISFYTRLFHRRFVDFAKNKLINLHPSILPACPGLDGFGDTIRSGAKFIGATIHLVDAGMDTGFPIIQSARPFNPQCGVSKSRHYVFVHQCKMLLQVLRWYEEGRIKFNRDAPPSISGAKYVKGEFSPNLDFLRARRLSISQPKSLMSK